MLFFGAKFQRNNYFFLSLFHKSEKERDVTTINKLKINFHFIKKPRFRKDSNRRSPAQKSLALITALPVLVSRLNLLPLQIIDSWSTSQISSQSISKPEDLKPASEPVPSITNTLKRRRRKLQHYSEILNAYEPFRSISAPLDETRTEAMYLRKLVDINRKFIANAREKALQRMKDREALSEWKDEYRALCNSTKRGKEDFP